MALWRREWSRAILITVKWPITGHQNTVGSLCCMLWDIVKGELANRPKPALWLAFDWETQILDLL